MVNVDRLMRFRMDQARWLAEMIQTQGRSVRREPKLEDYLG